MQTAYANNNPKSQPSKTSLKKPLASHHNHAQANSKPWLTGRIFLSGRLHRSTVEESNMAWK
jgi:hypothetical protein